MIGCGPVAESNPRTVRDQDLYAPRKFGSNDSARIFTFAGTSCEMRGLMELALGRGPAGIGALMEV